MQRKSFLWIIFPVMAVCLNACTTVQNYQARLNSWIGKSEMVMGLGIPDKQYQLDRNTKLVSYVAQNTAIYPGSLSTCYGAGGYHGAFHHCPGAFPATIETYHCETIFTLVDSRITRWGHKGNNCRA